MLRSNTRNIVSWWFAADTPIRYYKIQSNRQLQQACEKVGHNFVAPSGATTVMSYRRGDKLAFAQAVQQFLSEEATR